MTNINPSFAASLAADIYVVRGEQQLKLFLSGDDFFSSGKLLDAQVGSRLINTRDAFGVCARGAGQYSDAVFLIFRGTTTGNYGADFFTDARCGLTFSGTGSLVHAGFNQAFNSMKGEIARFFAQQTGVQRVFCIGHSLGGAVANLAAEWVSASLGKMAQLFTFGAPRVGFGMAGFPAKLTYGLRPENIHRVYHSSDPVPMVPLFPYCHAPTTGQPYYVPYAGMVINFSAHKMENYIGSVSGKTWPKLYQPEPLFSSHSALKWLESNGVESIENISTWHKLQAALVFVTDKIVGMIALPVVVGLTVADYLAMLLSKGLKALGEVANWVLLLIRKMMRMLGMAVVDTVEALSEQLIKQVLSRVINKINSAVMQAVSRLR